MTCARKPYAPPTLTPAGALKQNIDPTMEARSAMTTESRPGPGVALSDDAAVLIERLLDAQQDINFAANTTMDQSLCDASALIDEVEAFIRKNAAAALSAGVGQPAVSVQEMRLSDGRSDFYVAIRCGDREVTPHVFRERFKAEYHVALYDWLLNGGDEPNVIEFNENDWPAKHKVTALATPVAAGEADLVPCERCQGNGEIVTDWDRYRHPHEGDAGDEAVSDCPDCDGRGEREPAPPAEPVTGWIVGNGAGDRWRCWRDGMSDWTADRNKATRYARRQDAEDVHREDEDAWRVEPYATAEVPHAG